MTDHSKRRIEPDGHICTNYSSSNCGHEPCRLLYVSGDVTYSVQDGILVNVTHKIVPGNRCTPLIVRGSSR